MLVLQHPVEGQVNVDLAVARAVEGAGPGDAHAAGRLGAAGKQHETRWCVAGAIGAARVELARDRRPVVRFRLRRKGVGQSSQKTF